MKKFFLLLWLVMGGVMLVLSLTPNLMSMPNQADKVLHAVTYTLFMLWPATVFQRYRYVLLCAFLAFSVGVGIEILQKWVAERSSSVGDVLANIVGIVLGLLIGYLLRSGYYATNKPYPKR